MAFSAAASERPAAPSAGPRRPPAHPVRAPRSPAASSRLPATAALVGAGRAGTAVAAALAAAGVRVLATTATPDRSAASRRRAAALLPGVPARPAVDAVAGAELVLLGVPDDALPEVVADLAGHVAPGTVVVHLSGAAGLALLGPVAGAGAVPLALHPAQTLAGHADDLERLRAAAVGVTARDEDLPLARALVDALGATALVVPEAARPAYHAALCHGANHLVALVADAAGALAAAGVESPSHLLRPLLEAALARALDEGVDGLTGPVRRGDAGTVAAHLAALGAVAPGVVPPYAALARRTAALAADAGQLGADVAARVVAALDTAVDPAPGATTPAPVARPDREAA